MSASVARATSWLRPRLSTLRADAWLLAYAVAGALLSRAPARWRLGQHLSQGGTDPAAYLFASLSIDLRDGLWSFVALPLLVACLYGWWRRKSWRGALRAVLVPLSVILFLSFLVLYVAAAQFKIERGIFPTPFDVAQGGGDAGFFTSYLHVFTGSFLAPSLACLAVFAVLSVAVLRGPLASPTARAATDQGEAEEGAPWWARIGLAAAAAALLSWAGAGLHRASPRLFSSIPSAGVIESPMAVFFELGAGLDNMKMGALWLFGELELPADDGRGATLMGWPRLASARVQAWTPANGCAPHPFRSPLDTTKASDGAGEALRFQLRALSGALWDDTSPAPVVWHVALEGIRGDDVHAVNALAPEAITPRLAELYRRKTALSSRHMFQGGYRTSQGLASLFCGLGTAPYGISLIRDLGNLPLRCMPDVLRDAGFMLGQYIGSNPSFDAKHLFAGYHAFDLFLTEKDWRETAGRTGWGIPDLTMVTQAHERTEQLGAGAQYHFILTLSNHAPHILPGDFPAELSERVRSAFDAAGQAPNEAHIARMSTYAYTDHALGALIDLIEASPNAGRTIIVVSADHGVDATYLWRGERRLEPDELAAAHALIPFVVLFPEALLARAPDRAAAERALGHAAEQLDDMALSQNDIPLLVLDLLSHTKELRALDPEKRWHTLGGQRLSPDFVVPHDLDVKVIGINNQTRLFQLRRDGTFIPGDEVARLSLDLDVARELNPTLQPTASLLSRFLRGYAKHCWSAEHIRAR